MLINREALNHALEDFSARNELIESLTHSKSRKNAIFRAILAFWLGSNIELERIKKFNLKEMPLIVIVYYCLLILDKAISLRTLPIEVNAVLRKTQKQFFAFYNKNIEFSSDPMMLVRKLGSLVSDMSVSHKTSLPYLDKITWLIFNELKWAGLLKVHDKIYPPQKQTMQLTHQSNLLFSIQRLRQLAQRFLTCNFNQYPFFASLPDNYHVYHPQKLFLSAKDGTILEGLYVSRKTPTRIVVLALVGHFQAEFSYVSNYMIDLHNIFSKDIVFINHRNYSTRSNKFATHIYELAEDVVAFVNFFNKQNKQIVLYGMCGGSAHMMIAANLLKQKNIPFKLIVDRFVSKYSDVIDTKSLYAQFQDGFGPGFPLLNTFKGKFIFLAAALFSKVGRTAFFSIPGANVNFARLIRKLPPEDVLVLQAKSKKQITTRHSLFTDHFVHPKNNIRNATKESRFLRKNTLKNLANICGEILTLEKSYSIQASFLALQLCFKKCLELIDNEKLTKEISFVPLAPMDLHSDKLPELTTRHMLPISQFLQGFIATPKVKCDSSIKAFKPYAYQTLLAALQKSKTLQTQNLARFASLLTIFCSELKTHEAFLIAFGNRLMATGLGNLKNALQELLDSEIFKIISEDLHPEITNSTELKRLELLHPLPPLKKRHLSPCEKFSKVVKEAKAGYGLFVKDIGIKNLAFGLLQEGVTRLKLR